MAGLKLLLQAQAAGLNVFARGERLIIRGPRSAESLARNLLRHKAEILLALRQEHRPFIDAHGILIIPTDAPARYRWWQPQGQGLRATLKELSASPDVLAKYVDTSPTVLQ